MELNKIQFIRVLIVESNLSKVAERFHMTQSALSKRIKSFEEELGFPLFERCGPKGLIPLPQAYEIAELIDQTTALWQRGIDQVNTGGLAARSFSLVGPQLFMREIFLPWWSENSSQFPELQIEVRIPALRIVSLETLRLASDAAILEKKEELPDHVCKELMSEQWGIVYSPTSSMKPEAENLEDYSWCSYAKQVNPVERWLVHKGRLDEPHYEVYWEDLSALGQWIADGTMRASVLPYHAVQNLVATKRVIFESLGPTGQTHLYLAYPVKTLYKKLLDSLQSIAKRQALNYGNEQSEPEF